MKTNFPLKVAAVVLAVAMWLFVISRGQTEVSMQVPVVVENVPAGLYVAGESAKTVVVDLRGHERFVRRLRPGDVTVVLDAGAVQKGDNKVRIKSEDVKAPAALKVTGIRPAAVDLDVEKTYAKTVPVYPVVDGTPKKGYKVTRTEVSPSEVVVSGGRRRVSFVSSVKTEVVDISGADKTVSHEVALNGLDRGLSADPAVVVVKVIIAKELP